MNKGKKYYLIFAILIISVFLSSCDEEDDGQIVSSGNITVQNDVESDDIFIDIVRNPKKDNQDGNNESDESLDDESDDDSQGELASFDPDNSGADYDSIRCSYDKSSKKVKYDISFSDEIPKGDDGKIYLFELSTYENEKSLEGKTPLAGADCKSSVTLTADYKERYLFSRFVPGVLSGGVYYPIAGGHYISNPGELASVSKSNSNAGKKGILIDSTTIGTDNLKSLNVSRIIYNIPLSYIIGETSSAANPTVNYEYNGKVYHFNGQNLMLFDTIFSGMTNAGYHCTAIILNDWNPKHPELVHPSSRAQTGRSLYYAFNTEEESGVRLMEAAALFLAERYSKGDHGMVYDWVIGNEVNQQKIWNYMACDDVDTYTESFERSFRTFYNAIKSKNSGANISFSIDHDWNDNGGNNSSFFNGKDLLSSFNKYARKRGNYNWGLAIHPYPVPLTNARFWEGTFDKSENAKALTPMNLSTLTSFMRNESYLDCSGNVRYITITELGFSSVPDEATQAAAFAYCYNIVNNNKYIKAFILNRQTDDPTEMADGLAFGVYKADHSPKIITDVFKNVDNEAGKGYIPQMLGIIGAGSLEEALARAQ